MRDQDDPHVLDALYALDSLTCQSLRHAENLQVLSGRPVLDGDAQVTSLTDIVLAAMGRVEDWQKITVGSMADIAVAQHVSGDVIRAISELLDNAARFSPPYAPVIVAGHLLADGGALLRIEDEGVGLNGSDLARHNGYLQASRLPANAAPILGGLHHGLRVVRHAIDAHRIAVSLTRRVPLGTAAAVYIPPAVLSEVPGAAWNPTPVGFDAQRDRAFSGPSMASQMAGDPVAGAAPTVSQPYAPVAASAPPPATTADLPTRVPAPMRWSRPEPSAPPVASFESDALRQIVAFNAATSGTAAHPTGKDITQ